MSRICRPNCRPRPSPRRVAAGAADSTVAAGPAAAAADAAEYAVDPAGAAPVAVATTPPPWLSGLEHDARTLLDAGEPMVWDTLLRRFEAQLIRTALEITRGRRIEAAQKLGIGRNTITRKIQELGLDD